MKIGKITKKEIREASGITCQECGQPATIFINSGEHRKQTDGTVVDLCTKDFILFAHSIDKFVRKLESVTKEKSNGS